ncbi:MAG: alpha/beta fold hydrolase [Bacteroidaceae bacterium]|nr:alpha/beta fold hydrolase [Bacteroidaceae bacterium]
MMKRKATNLLRMLCTVLLCHLMASPLMANGDEYVIKNGERTLYGVLSKPHYQGKRQGIVILAHGFGGTHHFAYAYFDALNRLGYQAYAFDFASGSPFSRSDKNTMNMSVLDQQRQLETVIEHFRRQPDIDPKRIVLLGESQGGLVSALTAASNQKKISRLVLVFPAFCIPYHWRARYPTFDQVPDTTRLWRVPMGRQYFKEILDMDAFQLAKAYKKPVLIVHGDADQVVPYADSEKMQKLYKKATLHCIPGAGHGFNPEQQAQNLGYIIPFLQE